MLLAQISDLHLDGTGPTAERSARVVEYLRSLTTQPDAVLVTGDIADHGAPDEYAEAAALLATLTPPVFTCPGNHDERTAYRKVLLDEEDAPGAVNRLHHAAGYAFLMLDSTIPGEDAGLLDDETLDWLTRTLDGLGGTPAVPVLHHPPTPLHHPYIDTIRLRNAGRLADVLAGRSNIPAVLTGHAHTPAATTFAGRPLLVAPGVTSTLRLPWEKGETLTSRTPPPGVAFHVLDEDGGITTHFRAVA
ncbi:metallophosphoesterase [Streptomyces sp. NBC_01766]|uniref:metallophosphoesterase n=1 Tax=Streptomyces sp. NBC_01766 TaxID=2975936 RepID=UPI002DDB3641|nr:metallophosphoesterase [Streptomyces sp. NBC_01766]WSC20640.1 metallophosphoesterase [Streptomyces sp. NBC_01766]